MDKPIDLADLRPTRAVEQELVEPRLPLATADVVRQLREQTKALFRHPYDPSNWIARAGTLALMGFPELASGDALKAMRLCQDKYLFLESHPGETWKLGRGRGFSMRDDDDRAAEGVENLSRLRASFRSLETEARAILEDCTAFRPFVEGVYVPQAYPWLEDRHRGRNASVVEAINRDIRKSSVKTASGEPYIEVKRCAFQPGDDVESVCAALGVFATCNIEKDTMVLTDVTELFGCIGQGDSNSTANLHGAQGCLQRYHPNLPKDARLSLRWIRDRAGKEASDILLLCRTLMHSVKRNLASPLDLPAIARLVPTYRQRARTFTPDHDMTIVYDALVQFGVDIFAEHKYDTWVLFTICARLRNNSWTTPLAAALSPIFSLFNHSCEPNAEWQTRRDHRTIDVRVSQDVVAGEQLFVEYDSYAHDQPLQARRGHLAHWIERCMCSRCAREELQDDEMRERDGEEAIFRVAAGQGEDASAAREVLPTWDMWEKPSLPEDSFWMRVA